MGHSGSSAKGGSEGSGAKGWGDALKATLNPLADFTGQKDPFLEGAFKMAQKGSSSGSAGGDMLSTYDSRAKAHQTEMAKIERPAILPPEATVPNDIARRRPMTATTSLLTEGDE